MVAILSFYAAHPRAEAAVMMAQGVDLIVASTAPGGTAPGTALGTTGTGTQNNNNTQIRTGQWDGGAGSIFATVYSFQLPNLGLISNPFSSAAFSSNLNAINNPVGVDYGVDLYGLPSRMTSAISASDYYAGDTPDPAATLLQDSFLTTASPTGQNASSDIASYLNAQYAGGANAGDWVFIRMNIDGDTVIDDVRGGYLTASFEADTALQPFIMYDLVAVPEPSRAVLLSLACFGMLLRRRR